MNGLYTIVLYAIKAIEEKEAYKPINLRMAGK